MLSLATLRGVQRAVAGGRFLRDGRCRFSCPSECTFIARTRNKSFSCSPSFNQCRCFGTTSAKLNTLSSPAANHKTPSYSYVIVGAGSAGCVLANRLSEDSHESVLLLEAGPSDMLLGNVRLSWKIHMPAALTYNLCNDKYNCFITAVLRLLYLPKFLSFYCKLQCFQLCAQITSK